MRRSLKYIFKILVSAVLILSLSSCSPVGLLFTKLPPKALQEWKTTDELTQTDDILGFDKMEKMASTSKLSLYFNEKTTEIAIKTADDTVWFSNPQNRLELNSSSIDKYSSPLLVNIIDVSESPKQMNAFADSVKFGQFSYKKINNGIRVEYNFGRVIATPIYPQALPAERFEDIIKQLSEKEQKNMEAYYLEVNYDTVKDKQALKNLEEKYKRIAEVQHIYTLKQSPSPIETNRITDYLTKLEYTSEQREKDHILVGYTDPDKARGNFVLPVEYTLDEDNFQVKIVVEDIKVTDNIKLDNIILLPFFNTKEGYSASKGIVPDGSGGIIDLEIIRSGSTPEYDEPIYGQDYALFQSAKISQKKNIYFPVYGITNANGAMFGVIKSGDATSSINASARISEQDIGSIGVKFKFIEYAKVKLTSTDTQTVNSYSEFPIDEDMIVDFKFLKQESDWITIAKGYKKLLQEDGMPSKLDDNRLPVIANVIGAIDDTETFLGVPREIIRPLTNFNQVTIIANELSSVFSNNQLVLRYSGWRKGGLKSGISTNLHFEKKLGNTKDFNELITKLNKMGVIFSPDIDFQYVYRDKAFDGFRITRDVVRFITSEAAYKPQYNMANFMVDKNSLYGYILLPSLMPKITEKLIDDINELDFDSISLSYLASDLSGSFNKNDFITRNKAKAFSVNTIQNIKNTNSKVLSIGANAYTLPLIDYAVDIPTMANAHPIIDRSIPFVQMVLSGSVKYSAGNLNNSQEDDYYLLKCIETGSAMYFSTIYESNALLKNTAYDEHLSVNFETLKSRIIDVGTALSEALAPVYGSAIINYIDIEEGVVRIDYENGKSIFVNYTNKNIVIDDGIIPAKGWLHSDWRQ